MKKNTKILFLAALMSLCFAFGVACSNNQSNSSSTDTMDNSVSQIPEEPEYPDVVDEEMVYENSAFKDTYSLNEELHMNYLLTDIDGATYTITKGELEYPNGKIYDKKNYTLSEVGKYTLTYTAKLDNVEKTGVKEFMVLDPYYSLTSEYSSVEYGENLEYTVFTNGTYKNGEKDVTAWGGGLDTATAKGIKVSLAEGDEFKWNEPLKLTSGVNDLFNILLPQATAYTRRFPELTGVPKQANRIIATLTDCYDSNKKIELVFDFSRDLGLLCIRAGVNGDTPSSINKVTRNSSGVDTGYRAENPKTYFFLGEQEYVCIYGTRGTQVNAMSPGGYTLSLNTDTAELFATTRAKADKEPPDTNATLLVNAFNNKDIHTDESTHFMGFTNGEAYLSIKCEDYLDTTCEFILTNILGSQEGFEGNDYEDKVVPFIDVDVPSETISVVKDNEFSIFDAKCYDANLKGDYKVNCYYAYGEENQTSIKIVDGKLNLPVAGKYSLVYSVYDTFGNRAEKVITLNAKASGEVISYNQDNKLTEIRLGEEVTLPDISVVGLNGIVNVESSITDENGNIIEKDANDRFMCVNAGKYKITYVMSDGVYTKEFAYEVNGISNEENIQFLDSLTLGDYLMKGRTYYFDEYYAYTFESATPTSRKVEVYANVDDSGFERIENYNNYLVEANATIQFKYVYNGKEKVSNEMQVVDAGLNTTNETLNLPGYFITDGNVTATKAEEDDFVKVVSNGNSTLNFINPISFNAFLVQFMIPTVPNAEKETRVFKINYVLTDFYDDTKSMKISFSSDGEDMKFFVNDKSVKIDNGITGKKLKVEYKNKQLQTDAAAISVENIFTADKVTLSISFETAEGNLELQLYKINGQALSVSKDNMAPDICLQDVGGRYAVGSTVTLFTPIVTDVLSPVNTTKTTITVKGTSGYYKDVNGNVLNKFVITEDIQVEFNSIEKVNITYNAEDAAGKQLNKKYTLDIVDTTAPTIALQEGFDKYTIKSVSLGETVKVATYTVSDDVTSMDKLEVKISIFTPYNEMYVLEGDTFVAERRGSYRIVYSCVDGGGNMVETYYTVNVD